MTRFESPKRNVGPLFFNVKVTSLGKTYGRRTLHITCSKSEPSQGSGCCALATPQICLQGPKESQGSEWSKLRRNNTKQDVEIQGEDFVLRRLYPRRAGSRNREPMVPLGSRRWFVKWGFLYRSNPILERGTCVCVGSVTYRGSPKDKDAVSTVFGFPGRVDTK